MIKSYGNTIGIFLPEKELKKQVMSQIVTDNKSLEEPKDPATCNVFRLYELLATPEQSGDMARKYRAGNYGYGQAKTALFEVIMDRFGNVRGEFDRYMKDIPSIEKALKTGADKARVIAGKTISRVRDRLGYSA